MEGGAESSTSEATLSTMAASPNLLDDLSPLASPSQRLARKTRILPIPWDGVCPSEGRACALCPHKDTDEDLVDENP